jgi:hypothetical protein
MLATVILFIHYFSSTKTLAQYALIYQSLGNAYLSNYYARRAFTAPGHSQLVSPSIAYTSRLYLTRVVGLQLERSGSSDVLDVYWYVGPSICQASIIPIYNLNEKNL